ncbi:MAG: DUF2730 family protein [Alphaproteobacteria bacterium]|nr:DUF2730 family protein [Alphaproteobacteria bacterium]
MMTFLQDLAPWVTIIMFVLQFATGLFILAMSRKFPTRAEHEELKDTTDNDRAQQANLMTRIYKVEETLGRLPDQETVHELSLQMTRLEGRLESMFTKFDMVDALGKRMQRQIDVMDEWLKRGANK